MSDILFTGCHPYLGDGDAEQLLKALREISRLDASFFVPGHGPVGTIEDVKLLIAYVEGCLETARSLVDQGRSTDEEIRALKIPGQFQDWLAPEFYPANLRFLCQRMGPGD